jgi:hypothetical protein
MYMKSLMRGVGIVGAAAACAAVFGVGVPLAWVWLASRLQTTTGPNSGVGMLAATVVIVGPLASYIALVALAGRFRFTQRPDSEPQRMAWTRSRNEIRQRARYTTTFEEVVLTTVLIVGVGFEVWFFFLAKCSSAACFG